MWQIFGHTPYNKTLSCWLICVLLIFEYLFYLSPFCHISKSFFPIASGIALDMPFQFWVPKEISFLHSHNSLVSRRYRPLCVVVLWWYIIEKFDKILLLILKTFMHAHNVSWLQLFSISLPDSFQMQYTLFPSQLQVLFVSLSINPNLCCLYTQGCGAMHRMYHKTLKTYCYIMYFKLISMCHITWHLKPSWGWRGVANGMFLLLILSLWPIGTFILKKRMWTFTLSLGSHVGRVWIEDLAHSVNTVDKFQQQFGVVKIKCHSFK